MVKNKGGNKTKGKSRKTYRIKELGLKDLQKIDNQEYAFVIEVLGDGRCQLMCYDKIKRLGILRGKLRRTTRINKSDLVLVSLRGFQDNKCDILAIYNDLDKEKLIKAKELYYSFTRTGELIEDLKDEFKSPDDDNGEEIVNKEEINKINTSELNIEDI
tara:strand:+ start:2929 stop:3405 length:477 start_codon:yes stop_codon:yes gene_type:complete